MKGAKSEPELDVREFFQREASQYVSMAKEGDDFKIELLKELAQTGDSLLDIGCGNGYFADRALNQTNISKTCVLDTSSAMLSLNKKLPSKELCLASALYMPFKPHTFTFVHFDDILHHLVGTNRKSSLQKAYDTLTGSVVLTQKGGFLILTEMCVDSYFGGILLPLIYYALKFMSRTWLVKLCGIPSGLIVSFLRPGEFLSGIRAAGTHIVKTRVTHCKKPFLFRLALCKDYMRIHILASPEEQLDKGEG